MKSQTGTVGEYMHDLARRLFPIGRSITGDGVRETLQILQEHIPLEMHEVPTGTQAFDWKVPQEWNVKDAYILTPDGKRIADYKTNTLHLVGYSTPVDAELSLSELQEHLHSLPEQPDAIPYLVSYYEKRWGFCLTHKERSSLQEGTYRVHIDSQIADGSLTYGDLVIPGTSKKEVLLSTYVCHPSMANNELSGPVLATALAKWLMEKQRKYTYRIVFIPETIGSLVYVSRHIEQLKKNTIAGFVLSCVGDDRSYSFLASRNGNTLADRVALRILQKEHPGFASYTYLLRGSDERTYCSPGVDLPVVSIMRTKYGSYPEYHTSLDDLTVVTPKGLQGSFEVYTKVIGLLEARPLYLSKSIGEPQLGRRGLYPTLRKGNLEVGVSRLLDILAYADGTRLPEDIADLLSAPLESLEPGFALLEKNGLIEEL